MQPVPYKKSESLNEVIAELDKRCIPFTTELVPHAKGRCKQYSRLLEMHIRQIDNNPSSGTKIFVSHGAYVLSFTAPMDREMHIKIIDAIKETITKKEIMIEESGLLDLSVRTVMRGRNCTYCNKEINRGENYIRRASFRRELNICRECAEKELQTICSELAKQTDTKCKVVMQRW